MQKRVHKFVWMDVGTYVGGRLKLVLYIDVGQRQKNEELLPFRNLQRTNYFKRFWNEKYKTEQSYFIGGESQKLEIVLTNVTTLGIALFKILFNK